MKRSSDRILTTHAGALPRPDDLTELLTARHEGQPYDADALTRGLQSAVVEVVQKQVESGIDIVNDGEVSKPHFSHYIRERLARVLRAVQRGARPDAVEKHEPRPQPHRHTSLA